MATRNTGRPEGQQLFAFKRVTNANS